MPALAYLLTFGTYASRLHGDERGSWHHSDGYVGANAALRAHEERRTRGDRVELDARARETVLAELRRTCAHRGWRLIAAHVRTEHVHVVVAAYGLCEDVLFRDLKAWTSRRVREQERDRGSPQTWARGGNATRLWTDTAIADAKRYVLEQQGTPMSWWAE